MPGVSSVFWPRSTSETDISREAATSAIASSKARPATSCSTGVVKACRTSRRTVPGSVPTRLFRSGFPVRRKFLVRGATPRRRPSRILQLVAGKDERAVVLQFSDDVNLPQFAELLFLNRDFVSRKRRMDLHEKTGAIEHRFPLLSLETGTLLPVKTSIVTRVSPSVASVDEGCLMRSRWLLGGTTWYSCASTGSSKTTVTMMLNTGNRSGILNSTEVVFSGVARGLMLEFRPQQETTLMISSGRCRDRVAAEKLVVLSAFDAVFEEHVLAASSPVKSPFRFFPVAGEPIDTAPVELWVDESCSSIRHPPAEAQDLGDVAIVPAFINCTRTSNSVTRCAVDAGSAISVVAASIDRLSPVQIRRIVGI